MKEYNIQRAKELSNFDVRLTSDEINEIVELENEMSDDKDSIIRLISKEILDSNNLNHYIEKCFDSFLVRVHELLGSNRCKKLYDYLPGEKLGFIVDKKQEKPLTLYDFGLEDPISELELSQQLVNVLKKSGIINVFNLASHSENDILLKKGTTRAMINEINSALSQRGLRLGIFAIQKERSRGIIYKHYVSPATKSIRNPSCRAEFSARQVGVKKMRVSKKVARNKTLKKSQTNDRILDK